MRNVTLCNVQGPELIQQGWIEACWGWQWHHIWNLCIRTGDSDTPSGVLIIAHPASSWSGGFHSVLSRPVDLLLVFDDSATVHNEMDMDMADMGQNYQVTTPRKKKHHLCGSIATQVWPENHSSLMSQIQASKAPVRLRLVRFCEMLLGMLCILLSTSVGWSRSETPPKKNTRESSAFWTWIKLTDAKKKPYTWIVSIDKIT